MKKALGFISAGAAFLTLAPMAFAQSLCPTNTSGNFGALCGLKLDTLLSPLINLIFILAVVVALIYLIYGGFRWLTSGGDKAAVQAAREHIVAALIGLVIIFLSYFILNVLISFFVPGFQFSSFTLPHL